MSMSLIDNKTGKLWRNFMLRRKEIRNNIGTALYSMQLYDMSYFSRFDPAKEFEKWATIEVTNHDNIPDAMEAFTLPEGLYAVFLHKGPASAGHLSFQYIFGFWLPNSEYMLDDRPHFELLGEKYKNEESDSEEEIWIPVKRKE